jgi:hypothetical protein
MTRDTSIDAPETLDDTPHPYDFAEQLCRQVIADLDGVLFDGETAADDAVALVISAIERGEARGAALWVLVRAALAAHHALVFGVEEHFSEPHDRDVLGALAQLAPAALGHEPYWQLCGPKLAERLSAAEGNREAVHAATTRAIFRLYDGLRSGDEVVGGRGLIELRAMATHLDACAQLGDEAEALVRVIRPDRFHDDFLRYTASAQAGSANVEQPVATLSQEGRLTAVITGQVHPVEHARQTLLQNVGRDAEETEATVLRVEALLDFLDRLRRDANPFVRSATEDETVFIGLVTAAATAPLRNGGGFVYAPLLQIARYNQMLLRASAIAPQQAH